MLIVLKHVLLFSFRELNNRNPGNSKCETHYAQNTKINTAKIILVKKKFSPQSNYGSLKISFFLFFKIMTIING